VLMLGDVLLSDGSGGLGADLGRSVLYRRERKKGGEDRSATGRDGGGIRDEMGEDVLAVLPKKVLTASMLIE
jgi:hypothetical protein